MKKTLLTIITILLLTTVAGCSSKDDYYVPANPEKHHGNGPGLDSDKNYPEIQIKDLSSFYTEDNYAAYDQATTIYNDFALELVRSSINKSENEIISPLSVFYALAILTNGAGGTTLKELESALGMTIKDVNEYLLNEARFPAYSAANALYLNTGLGISFSDSFRNTIDSYYNGSAYEKDFADPNAVANEVNNWAAGKTNGAIRDLVGSDEITKDTPFLILNALATGERWSYPFDKSKNTVLPFTNYSSSKVNVEMMNQTFDGYYGNERADAFVKMLDNFTSVVAILPKEGTDVYDYLDSLTAAEFNELITHQYYYENENYDKMTADQHRTILSFPKYEYEAEYDLNESLRNMGLKNIFDPAKSDFSPMVTGNQKVIDQLMVSRVKQKAKILVNEERVEAAAATVVEGGLGAMGFDINKYIDHRLVYDRPFIFMLCRGTEIMFAGVISEMQDCGKTAAITDGGFPITIICDGKIKVRTEPSKKGVEVYRVAKGETLTAYEKTANEGYTWYRIGTSEWIADSNGEWIAEY